MKMSFSHKIEEEFAELFEKMYRQMGPPKYRILEAAIEVFSILPKDIQYRLKGLDPAERQPILDFLSTISVPSPTPFGKDPALDVSSVVSDAERAAKKKGKAGRKAN
ncbi:MAG: hypothetical protein ACYSUX_19150 [Planctomycetota bacterium]